MDSLHPLFPKAVRSFPMFIDGKEYFTDKKITRTDPAHAKTVSEFCEIDETGFELAVGSAVKSFRSGDWSCCEGNLRSELLHQVASEILKRQEEFALVESLETGKPISQAKGEIAYSAELWKYAAGLARVQHGDAYTNLGDEKLGLVLKEPVGVVGIIVPWNFPFLLLSERLPFALAAGCSVILKPSELTGGTAMMLGEILGRSNLPKGVVNLICGAGDIGQRMAEHPEIDMISFTGSTQVGKKVMRAASNNVKKIGLELGGKNPMIVFEDADRDAALDAAVFSAYFNAGQCCISSSRLLVEESIAEDFTERLIEATRQIKPAETLEEATKVGAIVNDAQLEKIVGHVRAARENGAQICCGGNTVQSLPGRFYEPTVIRNVSPEAALMQEEVFGPVLAVMPFKKAEDAVAIANNSSYGLAGSVWTRDVNKGLRTIRKIRCGKTWLNSVIEGYPELPLGGMKQSGVGRETGRFGIEEYTELKTVLVHLGKRDPVWI